MSDHSRSFSQPMLVWTRDRLLPPASFGPRLHLLLAAWASPALRTRPWRVPTRAGHGVRGVEASLLTSTLLLGGPLSTSLQQAAFVSWLLSRFPLWPLRFSTFAPMTLWVCRLTVLYKPGRPGRTGWQRLPCCLGRPPGLTAPAGLAPGSPHCLTVHRAVGTVTIFQ